jgi:hypothetical protein
MQFMHGLIMVARVFRTVLFLSGLLGIIYFPADMWGICEPYPLICASVRGMDRFQTLLIFSVLLVSWSVYRDWREPFNQFRKWRRGKRGLYSVENIEVFQPDGGALYFQRPQVAIRFHKSVSSAKIELYIRSSIGLTTETVYKIGEMTVCDVMKGQIQEIKFGLFRIEKSVKGNHVADAYWGIDNSRSVKAELGTGNILTINVNRRGHSFYVYVPTYSEIPHKITIIDQDECWLHRLHEGTASKMQP